MGKQRTCAPRLSRLLVLSSLTDAVRPLHMSGRQRLWPPRRFLPIKMIFNNFLMGLDFLFFLPSSHTSLWLKDSCAIHDWEMPCLLEAHIKNNCCYISCFLGWFGNDINRGWWLVEGCSEVCSQNPSHVFPWLTITGMCVHTDRQTVTVSALHTACYFGCMS